MVLNHVARRASTAQGMGVLTLHERAFAVEGEGSAEVDILVRRLRAGIRIGEVKGHLPVAFGVMTAGLGMSLGEWRATPPCVCDGTTGGPTKPQKL